MVKRAKVGYLPELVKGAQGITGNADFSAQLYGNAEGKRKVDAGSQNCRARFRKGRRTGGKGTALSLWED